VTEGEIWCNKAMKHLKRLQLDKTLMAVDRALRVDPRMAMAWNIKSLVLYMLSRFDEGFAAIDHALEIEPNNESYWTNKAIALRNLSSLQDGDLSDWSAREEGEACAVWADELKKHPKSTILPQYAHTSIHTVAILLSRDSWEKTLEVLLEHQRLLFTDIAEKTLELLEQRAELDDDSKKDGRLGWIVSHRRLLSDARAYGIEEAWSAFEAFLRLMESIPPAISLAPPRRRLPVQTTSEQDLELAGAEVAPTLQPLIDKIGRGLRYFKRMPSVLPEVIRQIEEAIERVKHNSEGNQLLLAQLLQWLGGAWQENPAGNKEDNIEHAIAACEEALTILSSNKHRLPRALILTTLAAAYDQRLRGIPDANRERALGYYKDALRIYTREEYPCSWAATQENMAVLYLNRTKDTPAVNLELALMCHEEALRVFTGEEYPIEWGQAQMNMGNLYQARLYDDRAENIRKAIACYESALEALEYTPSMIQFAQIERNLGLAYTKQTVGDRIKNLDLARIYFDTALRIFDEDDYPTEHREVRLDIAHLEASRQQWEAAHDAYSAARELEEVSVRRAAGQAQRDRVIKAGRDAAIRDGLALIQMGKAEAAAVEIERGRARGLAEAQAIWNASPDRIHDAHRRARYTEIRDRLIATQSELDAPMPEKVGEGQERTRIEQRQAIYRKAREVFYEVVEEIRRAGDPVDFLDDRCNSATILRAASSGGQGHALVYLVATPWGGAAVAAFGADRQHGAGGRFVSLDLPELTDNFVHNLIETELDPLSGHKIGGYAHAQEGNGYSVLLRRQDWPGETFKARAESLHSTCEMAGVKSTLDKVTQKILTIPELAVLTDRPTDELSDRENAWLDSVLAEYFMRFEITRCLAQLSTTVMRPVVHWLLAEGVTSTTLIPCGALAAFPLGAAIMPDGRTAAETLTMSVAPSARSLIRDGRLSRPREGVYTLGNPHPTHQDLFWAEAEANYLAVLGRRPGQPNNVQTQEHATREWFIEVLQKALIIDASCHGRFDPLDFLNSALVLANGQVTLGDMLSYRKAEGEIEIDLLGILLIILSACQTAILDIRGARDEVRSLAVGMLQAGAQAVLASLWSVDDYATYLLIARFAQEWFPHIYSEPPAKALARAQYWLRTTKKGDLELWQEPLSKTEPSLQSANKGNWTAIRGRGNRYDAEDTQDDIPYAHPFFWAGFQITGW